MRLAGRTPIAGPERRPAGIWFEARPIAARELVQAGYDAVDPTFASVRDGSAEERRETGAEYDAGVGIGWHRDKPQRPKVWRGNDSMIWGPPPPPGFM